MRARGILAGLSVSPALAGWSDPDTSFGVAQRIDPDAVDNVLRAQQVASCELDIRSC